jgi:DNA replication and repair protein RecF
MYIKNIKLQNFRNYIKQEITLEKGINLFYGNNAQGKTNVIESIFLCSIGKSFRAKKDKELINFEKNNLFLEINYEKKDRTGKIKYLIENNNKEIFVNDIKLKKLSELLGNINIVLFSPEDINIIKDGPDKRRRFLNILISQLRPNYVYVYNLYQKTLEQKNTYLKKITIDRKDDDLLNIYDEKLAEYAEVINKYRNEFINKLKEKTENIHKNVTEEKETLKIKYISDCYEKEKYLLALKSNREKDIERGFTSCGVHRDDIYFFINGKKVDVFGSQGQQRTTILTLKLAELEVIKDEIGESPVLLLDDFMSELDNNRKMNFLKNIKNTQIIITCTDEINIENVNINKFIVNNGQVLRNNT